MNKEQKSAVVDRVASQIQDAAAIFAIDYRGISVKQAMELRSALGESGTRFQVVKNRLTARAADRAGAEQLKGLLEGPTAFAFVQGDAAVAAKAISAFRRQNGVLEWKGGTMDGETVTIEQIEAIARLPARDVLHGQFVGVLASPVTSLVRGLASLVSGIAIQLQQIQEQGLVGGEAPAAESEEATPAEEPTPAEEATPAEEPTPAEEAPGDAAAEAETAEEGEPEPAPQDTDPAEQETSEAPSEGEQPEEPQEG